MPENTEIPCNAYEPRGAYSHEYFSNEVNAYERLEERKCPHMPRYLGCYQLRFEDRGTEIDYDRIVNVIMLERIKGGQLSHSIENIDEVPFDFVEKMVSWLYESLDSIHNCGVAHGLINPEKCIVQVNEDGSLRPVWTDFTLSTLMNGELDSEENLTLIDDGIGSINTIFEPTYRKNSMGILIYICR